MRYWGWRIIFRCYLLLVVLGLVDYLSACVTCNYFSTFLDLTKGGIVLYCARALA